MSNNVYAYTSSSRFAKIIVQKHEQLGDRLNSLPLRAAIVGIVSLAIALAGFETALENPIIGLIIAILFALPQTRRLFHLAAGTARRDHSTKETDAVA